MYRTLPFHDDKTKYNETQIFSLSNIQESKIETFRGHKTSHRTLLVCSLILISTTGLLATWIFVAKPRFYPKLNILTRSSSVNTIEMFTSQGDSLEFARPPRGRRDAEDSLTVKKTYLNIDVITNEKDFPVKESRLPKYILPEEYHIHLNVHLDADNYTGSVKINFKCDLDTDQIIFHGRRILLNGVDVISNGQSVNYLSIVYLKKYELFVIELDGDLVAGKNYQLHMNYTSSYGKSLAGLYKSFYKHKDQMKPIVSTHFEPTDARSAFPCFDEPFFKAKFFVSISHKKGLTALSNMPIQNTRKESDDMVKDVFEPSVRMSTYLVAMTVNDFKYKEKITGSGIKVRCYAREDDYNRIDYAVEAGVKIISFYEDFFNIKYPLPKLDLLAVPDFMAGAMEDWGLVSFRSAYLIFDDKIMTVEYLRQITLVIAHELAHQWFGNLVTMKWWNDIWLNEGFANFVEMLGTNQVNPQFNALDIQVVTGWQAAISIDSLNNSHPVSQDVKRTSEIDELFDTISYNKGAALLRMVQGFMGTDFIDGVKSYLREYKFANAETDDLWKHLSMKSKDKLNIKEIMDSWTRQRSFPVLTLSREGTNDSKFIITQESFLDAKFRTTKEFNQTLNKNLWKVPFTYITDESLKTNTVWLNTTEMKIDVDTSIRWLKANVQSKGFYIVNYDNQTWYGLRRQLLDDYEVFSPVDRAGIIHDVFKLSCEKILNPVIALEVTKYISKEKDYIPWTMMRSKSECLFSLISNKSVKTKLKKYFWKMQSHLVDISMLDYSNVTTRDNLTIFESLQRMETFSYCLKHHLKKDYKKRLNEIFDAMAEQKSVDITPEVRALALMYGYNATSELHWNYLWQVYTNSEVDTDRKIVMKAFAQFRQKNRVEQILEKSLDKETMRVQDTIPLLANMVKIGSRKEVWDFVVKNYEKIKERYGSGYQLGQLLSEVAGGFNTKGQHKLVKNFFNEHPIGAKGSRTEKQILEKIENNIKKHSGGEQSKEIEKKLRRWLEMEEKR